jgi:hypothetical protein
VRGFYARAAGGDSASVPAHRPAERSLVDLGGDEQDPRTSPNTRGWTRLEYARLIELGVFRCGERLELLVEPARPILVAALLP